MFTPRIILIPSTAYYSGNYSRTIGSGLLERLPLLLPGGSFFFHQYWFCNGRYQNIIGKTTTDSGPKLQLSTAQFEHFIMNTIQFEHYGLNTTV